jgi:hypothetical protein
MWRMALMPLSMSVARSRISMSSQVMKGSHSAPLITRVSRLAFLARLELEVAGKYGTAEAYDTGVAQVVAQFVGGVLPGR